MGITKTQRNLLLAVAIGLLVYFLVPAANGLTPQGVRMLAVFIPVIFVWLIEGGSGWSALFAATMMVLIGAYNGAHTYELLWGGSMVAMIIPFYMISNALEESGAMMWVVRWILSRKVVHGRPTLFTILFVVSMVLSSVLINTMVIVVIFFKILRDITDSIGLDKDSEFFHAHGLLIGWIAQIADGCLIWGRPFILSMVGIIIGLGFRNFTMNDFFKLSGLYLLFACVVGIALIKFWVRPDTSAFEKFDDAAIREDLKANPMSKRAKTLLGGMVLAIVAYVCAFLTPLGSIQTYFNGLSVAAPISIIVATLCVITVDGKPAIDLGKEMGAASVEYDHVLRLRHVFWRDHRLGGFRDLDDVEQCGDPDRRQHPGFGRDSDRPCDCLGAHESDLERGLCDDRLILLYPGDVSGSEHQQFAGFGVCGVCRHGLCDSDRNPGRLCDDVPRVLPGGNRV
ncbi:MAG: hypothetical protein HFE83_03775 [Lachnospiraceae bacterium]|jgi:hypothetical protein|nr:hypothetical protein [Lachnospiraceae bacterium]